MARSVRVRITSGGGSSGGGAAPTGAAGGELAGTYPNPTVKDAVIDDANIVAGGLTTAGLAAAAGITSGQLAGSIAPSKVTGTAVTAADTGSVTSAMIADGAIVNADVNASAAVVYSKLNLAGVVLSGVEASRPAASAANAGARYYATDLLTVWESTGSAWTLLEWRPDLIPEVGTGGPVYSNCLRREVTNTTTGTSGTLHLVGVPIPKDFVVSKIVTRSAGTGYTLGAGADSHYYLAIYNQAGGLMASTADQTTTAWGSNTVKDLAIARDSTNSAAASWTSPATATYLVGFMVYFGTGGGPPAMGTMESKVALQAAGLNSVISGEDVIGATGGASLTSGTPATTITVTASASLFYMGVH